MKMPTWPCWLGRGQGASYAFNQKHLIQTQLFQDPLDSSKFRG